MYFYFLKGSCHSHDPNFHVQCGINNCTRSYENHASFRHHLKRKHPEVVESRREERYLSNEAPKDKKMNESGW